eukprot:TRINITY_DN1565_c1_g1_i1.p1 TRINITY_DN1565_c1_g1~~TRINITY_DN1565_c1_g1_i1.p1  ORF type:complete len:292 (+),score=65.28 TRINITY_DN1565_c1_g1_i1:71-946(+)
MDSVVDTHVHLSDREKWQLPAYSWHKEDPKIDHDFTPAVFDSEVCKTVEKVLFCECMTAESEELMAEEAKWVCNMASANSHKLVGAIASAPLGFVEVDQLRKYLDTIKHPNLKGIRQLIQGKEPGFGTTAKYIDGCKAIGEANLVVDFCVKGQLDDCIALAEKCPDTTFVLDHIGKPNITAEGGVTDKDWEAKIAVLSKFKNVNVKISGIITEVKGTTWTPALIEPYIKYVITTFSWDRVMYGSDWYASKLASDNYSVWINTLKDLPFIKEAGEENQRKLFKLNAERVYKL